MRTGTYKFCLNTDIDTYRRLYDEPEFQEGEMEEFAEGFDDDVGDDGHIVHSSAGGAPGVTGQGKASADRITTPYMTKYEKARILGTRALQIR